MTFAVCLMDTDNPTELTLDDQRIVDLRTKIEALCMRTDKGTKLGGSFRVIQRIVDYDRLQCIQQMTTDGVVIAGIKVVNASASGRQEFMLDRRDWILR